METAVPRGSKSSAAMNWVREQVLSGALSAGTVVRPEDVGKHLGISPTPAREGLQSLRTEGFLSSEPGVGFVVAELTEGDIKDVFMVHAFVAGELAARATQFATDEDINELEALHFELLAASRRQQVEKVEDRNHQFHRRISHLAQAPKLSQLLGLVSRYVPRTFYSEVGGWAEASSEDHEAIITAFRAKDTEAAREAMTEHIRHAGELLAGQYRSAVDSESKTSAPEYID